MKKLPERWGMCPSFVKLLPHTAGLLLTLFSAAPVIVAAKPEGPTRPTFAILGIPEEIQPLAEKLTDQPAALPRRTVALSPRHLVAVSPRPLSLGGNKLYTGWLGHTSVVVGVCGIGKVNAASLSTLILEHYHPRAVLFTGTSGGANPVLQPGDLVIGTETVQHDYGKLENGSLHRWATFNPETHQPNPLYFKADSRLLGLAFDSVAHLDLQPVDLGGSLHVPTILAGIIATGDQFIADASKVQQIRKELKADAVEMEGAAVAQVCWQQHVPCLIVRSVSDRANGDSPRDYRKFIRIASRNSAALARGIVNEAEQADRFTTIPHGKRVWQIAFELPFGTGSPYSRRYRDILHLPYPVQQRISNRVLGPIVNTALVETQCNRSAFEIGPGDYPDVPIHPSARLDVIADSSSAANLANALGYLAEQTEVLLSTPDGAGDAWYVDLIQQPSAQMHQTQPFPLALWSTLARSQPRLAEGFLPLRENGSDGIRIIDTARSWTPENRAAFDRAIRAVVQSQGLRIIVRWSRLDLFRIGNPWALQKNGERYLSRITGPQADRLRSRLKSIDRASVNRSLDEAMEKVAETGPSTSPSRRTSSD